MCPNILKFINLAVRNASEHGGIDVELLNRITGIYITRDVQIVTVLTDFITGHCTGISGNCFTVAYRIGNTFDVTFAQLVVFPSLTKPFEASIINTSSLSRCCLSTMMRVGIPVPKKILAGSPIMASMLFFSIKLRRILPSPSLFSSASPRKRTP